MDRSFPVAVTLIAVGFAAVVFFAVPGVPVVPVLAASLGVAALFILFWLFGEYLPLRRFLPLKQRFGFAAAPGNPDMLTGMWQGHRVRIHYHPANKRQRGEPWLTIELMHDLRFLPEIAFRRENLFYRLVKWIGLSREVQANDRFFDPRVYVESEDDEALSQILARPVLRAEVLALLRIPRATIALEPDEIRLRIRGHFGWAKYFRPDRVQEILDRLLAIKNSVAEGARPQSVYEPAPWDLSEGRTLAERLALLRHPPRLAAFLGCLSAFVGPAVFFWGTRYQPVSWRLHLLALGLAAVSYLLYVPLVFFLTRGRSLSHQPFFLFIFVALVGFPTFWVGSLKVINGFFDDQPPFAVEAQALRQSDQGRRLEVAIRLSGERRIVSAPIRPQHLRSLRPGDPLPIILSPGALGEPWVVGFPN